MIRQLQEPPAISPERKLWFTFDGRLSVPGSPFEKLRKSEKHVAAMSEIQIFLPAFIRFIKGPRIPTKGNETECNSFCTSYHISDGKDFLFLCYYCLAPLVKQYYNLFTYYVRFLDINKGIRCSSVHIVNTPHARQAKNHGMIYLKSEVHYIHHATQIGFEAHKSSGVKRPGYKADDFCLPSTEFENAWKFTSASSYTFSLAQRHS